MGEMNGAHFSETSKPRPLARSIVGLKHFLMEKEHIKYSATLVRFTKYVSKVTELMIWTNAFPV